jgi:hypothetical protein
LQVKHPDTGGTGSVAPGQSGRDRFVRIRIIKYAAGIRKWRGNDRMTGAKQVYVCPMHADVRQTEPGNCPKCRMALMPEGTRFGLLRHMFGNPRHLMVMGAVMVAIMAVAMMLMR